MDTQWTNRIVGYGEEPPDQLMANPFNHRIHPKRQQDALKGSLDTLGYIQTVIVNKTTGHIVDGHLRVVMALREEQKAIPVTYVELSEAEEAQALLSLDPIAALAGSDSAKVGELLARVQTDNQDVTRFLTDLAKDNKLDWGQPEQGDAEPQIDRGQAESRWKVSAGDTWKCGNHLVVCGDCTDAVEVGRLLGNDAYSMIADPPYNIGFNYASIDDEMPPQEYADFCRQWFELGSKGAIGSIVTPGPKNERLYPQPRDKGIWLKRYASAGASCFNLRCCEPIMFYGKFAKKRNFDWFDYSSGFTEELREAQRASRVEEQHPPAKPADLWTDLIDMLADGIVFDPFSGNGTTLMCCEKAGRVSRVMEIYPAYVAVALERWSQVTGRTPELVNQEGV